MKLCSIGLSPVGKFDYLPANFKARKSYPFSYTNNINSYLIISEDVTVQTPWTELHKHRNLLQFKSLYFI